MSVNPSPIGGYAAQFFDNNGVILSGGKIYTYAAGTTTPQATYTSASGVTPHSNPIVLDSAGRVPGGEIWLTDGLVYKFVIETSTAILIGTYDNITGVNSNFVNYTVQEEVQTATAGQTVFNLATINYTPGTNSLSVYIDGVNQYVGDSYLETDSNTVTFTSGLHVGAEVKFTTAVQVTTGAVNASDVGYLYPATGAVGQTVQNRLEQVRLITDFGAVLDGIADCSPAINAAINSLPATGGTIIIPDGAGCKLATTVSTGTTKPVRFEIGCTRIKCPPGEHGIVLQSNGSTLVGAGRWATVFELTPPASPMVYPTITTTLTTGAVTGTAIAGGSGMRSCPVAITSESPAQADTQSPDAGLILTQSGGTVSNVDIVAAGTGYVSAPTVSLLGGGHAAVVIDNVQSCRVSGFSVDFQNIPGTVGLYHRGGWWANVEDIDVFYNVTTGVSSESATSIGLVVDSYTLGAPGPTGGYGGVYVSQYSTIHFTRRALIGHDTSTGTTFQFNRCDFKNSWVHGCVDIVDVGPVAQANTGYFYDLINVDSLTLLGGDFENGANWFHFIGSCNNIRAFNTLAYAASGTRYRGQPGPGSLMDFAKSNDGGLTPIRYGSGGSAGASFQNTGWKITGHSGFDYAGDVFVIGAINLKLISATQGNLDDTSQNGVVIFATSSRELFIATATAGANPRSLSQFALFDTAGLKLPQLPSSAVTAGPKGLWYDPADGNRVKFVP